MGRRKYRIYLLCISIGLIQAPPTTCDAAETGPFSYDILRTENLTMRFTYQDGIRQNISAVPSIKQAPSISTQNASIESRLVPERLTFTAELSQSLLNDKTGEIRTGPQDMAWSARLSGRGDRYRWGLSTKHMGPGYITFSCPQGDAPRSRYDFDSTIDLGTSSVSLSALKKRDYLYDNEINPVVDTSQGTIRYTYSGLPGAMKLLTGYSLSAMERTQIPTSGTCDRNVSRTISLGTALAQPKWTLTPTYILKKTREISSTDRDIDTSIITITSEFRPLEGFSCSPQFSLSNTSRTDTRVQSMTRQSALNGRFILVPGILDISTRLSHTNCRTDNGSVDSDAVIAGGRADFSIDPFIPSPMRKSASIQAQMKRTRDHVGQNTTDEWEARAVFSITPRNAQTIAGSANASPFR